MPETNDVTAAWIEETIRLQGGVAIPSELLPRVLLAVREHQEGMSRFREAGIDVREVFPAQVYRAIRSEP